MYKNKKILSVIIAREKSKGLKNKNILKLANKPLVQWTIEASKKSKFIDYTLVSSDSKKIISLSKKMKVNAPFKRPRKLCLDNSKANDVLKHAVKWLKLNKKMIFDYVILLQPTSPLRKSVHIDNAFNYYFSKKKSYKETLVSVIQLPNKMGWIMKKNNKNYISFALDEVKKNINQRRQNLKSYFLPNGAIYIKSIKNLKSEFYSKKTLHFIMNEKYSIDIDNKEDFKAASNLINTKK